MGTHFANGVTNVSGNDEMAALRTVDPSQYYSWFDDFNNFTAAQWVVTETAAGSTQTIVDGAGGLFAQTNVSAGATDASQVQWAGTAATAILTTFWDVTKDLIMKTRFKLSTATTNVALIGAATVDTTLAASLPTDGLYFLKATGVATLTANVRKAGSSTSIALGTVADDTFCTASMVYTAIDGTWRGYFNGALTGVNATASISPTAGLSPGIALLNAAATAHVLTVDYLNIMVQR